MGRSESRKKPEPGDLPKFGTSKSSVGRCVQCDIIFVFNVYVNQKPSQDWLGFLKFKIKYKRKGDGIISMFNQRNLSTIAKMILLVMFIVGIAPIIPLFENYYKSNAESQNESVNEVVYKAVYYQYDLYQNGHPVDASWGNFGAYEAYILTEAGETVSEWVYGNSNLKEDVIKLIDDTILNSNEKTTDWFGNEVYVKTSKRVAQEYLAAKIWGETDRAQDLLNILKARQAASEDGSIDGNAFSDIPAFEAIGRSGDISQINTSKAIDYILANQDATTGAWTSSWNDFMVTAQAVRALTYLKDYAGDKTNTVQIAIEKGLSWLKGKQKEDGSFKNGWDDPAVDTAEVIYTLDLLDIDPNTWENEAGKTPVDYIRNGVLNSDGTFGTSKNLQSATWVLDAYLKLDSIADQESTEGEENSQESISESTSIKVYIAVIGKNGELLCGPKRIVIDKNDNYGLTALGALDAAGMSYSFSDEWEGFVEKIEGLKNEGMNGWMYAVNGTSPSVLAGDKKVKAYDKILWWYSEGMSGVPEWPSSNSSSGLTLSNQNTIKEMKKTLEEYKEKLSKIEDKISILNLNDKMTTKEAARLKEELEKNEVSIKGKVSKNEVLLTDSKTEISLFIPEKALSKSKEITVDELRDDNIPKQFAVKLGSSTYEFGPNGTKFDTPVTISIKLPITEDIDIKRLTPAWYDENKKEWIPISGLIDAKEGVVVFKIDHFTKFAVIELPNRANFIDVDESINWAKDAIEILAGQGIINGTGHGYEPQRAITRAEFIKLITKALDLKTDKKVEKIFDDIDSNDWFAEAVGIAYQNKIIIGDNGNKFRPNDKISRNEVATILYRLQNSKDENIKDYELDLKDKYQIPSWALEGVKFANKQELMIGYQDGTFKGDKPVTRAEAAVVIYRYLKQNMN